MKRRLIIIAALTACAALAAALLYLLRSPVETVPPGVAQPVAPSPPPQPSPQRGGRAEDLASTRVASLNVLGHGHTRPGGNRIGWPQAPERMRVQVETLDRHGVEIVAFQELQWLQRNTFLKLTRPKWRLWHPDGEPGNAVAWRADRWRLVSAEPLMVPYFDGHSAAAPVVRLRSRDGEQDVYVISVHNPASVRGPAERWRDAALRAELRLVARLAAGGVPVLLMGDFNERAEAFCTATSSGLLHAAAGGRVGTPCRPPKFDGIDWIFGTRDVGFSRWRVDTSLRSRRATDHPLVVTTVTFDGTGTT